MSATETEANSASNSETRSSNEDKSGSSNPARDESNTKKKKNKNKKKDSSDKDAEVGKDSRKMEKTPVYDATNQASTIPMIPAKQALDPVVISNPNVSGDKVLDPSLVPTDSLGEDINLKLNFSWLFTKQFELVNTWKMVYSEKEQHLFYWLEQPIPAQKNLYLYQEYLIKEGFRLANKRYTMPYQYKLKDTWNRANEQKFILPDDKINLFTEENSNTFPYSTQKHDYFSQKYRGLKTQNKEATFDAPFKYKYGTAELNERRRRIDMNLEPPWRSYLLNYESFVQYHLLDLPNLFFTLGLNIVSPTIMHSEAFWMAPPKRDHLPVITELCKHSASAVTNFYSLICALMRKVIKHKTLPVQDITTALNNSITIGNQTKTNIYDLINATNLKNSYNTIIETLAGILLYGGVKFKLEISETSGINWALVAGAFAYMAFTPNQCLDHETLNLCKRYIFSHILKLIKYGKTKVNAAITLPQTSTSNLGDKATVVIDAGNDHSNGYFVNVNGDFTTCINDNQVFEAFFTIEPDVLHVPPDNNSPSTYNGKPMLYPYSYYVPDAPYGNAFKVLNLIEVVLVMGLPAGSNNQYFKQMIAALNGMFNMLVYQRFGAFARTINNLTVLMCHLGLQTDSRLNIPQYPRVNSSSLIGLMMGVAINGLNLNAFAFDAIRWMHGFRWDMQLCGATWQYLIKGDRLSSITSTNDRRRIMKEVKPMVEKWFFTHAASRFYDIIIKDMVKEYHDHNQFIDAVEQSIVDLIADSEEIGGLSNSIILGGKMTSNFVFGDTDFDFFTMTPTQPTRAESLQDFRFKNNIHDYIGEVIELYHKEAKITDAYVPIFKINHDMALANKGEIPSNNQTMYNMLRTLPPYEVQTIFNVFEKNIVGGAHILLQPPILMPHIKNVGFKRYVDSLDVETTQRISWVKFQGEDESQWFRTDLIVSEQEASPE